MSPTVQPLATNKPEDEPPSTRPLAVAFALAASPEAAANPSFGRVGRKAPRHSTPSAPGSAVLLRVLLCQLPTAAGDDPCARPCGRMLSCAALNESFTCDAMISLGCDCTGCCLASLSPLTPPAPTPPPSPSSPPLPPPSPPSPPCPPSPPPTAPLRLSEVTVTKDLWESEVTWELACDGLSAPIKGGGPYEGTHAVPLGAPCTLIMRDSYGDGCMPTI